MPHFWLFSIHLYIQQQQTERNKINKYIYIKHILFDVYTICSGAVLCCWCCCWCCCTYTYHLLMIQYEHIKPTFLFLLLLFVCRIVVVIVVPSTVRICIISVFFFFLIFFYVFIHKKNICVYFYLYFFIYIFSE